MKRALFIFFLPLAFFSCKRKSDPNPVNNVSVVKYYWSSNSHATYEVQYTGADGNPVDTTYTGTSFVKTITVYRSSGFKIARFQFSHIDPDVPNFTAFSIDGEMTIYNNNNLEALHDVGLTNGSDFSIIQSCSTSIFGQ